MPQANAMRRIKGRGRRFRIEPTLLFIGMAMGAWTACTIEPDLTKLRRGTPDGAAGSGPEQPSFGGHVSTTVPEPAGENDATCTSYQPLSRPKVLSPEDDRVASLLRQLTPQQKIDMLSGGPACPSFDCDFASTGVPGFSSGPVKIPDWRMGDGPRGVHVLSGGKSTTFAVAIARAAAFDVDLEYRVGVAIGKESPALGIDLMLAPTVNVLRHPRWARAQETYGEDPILTGELGAAFVRGVQQTVGACPKHFVGNDTDNNREAVVAIMEEFTLREIYAKPFEMIVEKADPACIMAAYNGVNGDWCTENKHLLTEILRNDWRFSGVVLSDWWATKKNGAKSLHAGLDVEMPDKAAFQLLPQELSKGTIQIGRIDEAAGRILNVRAKFGQLGDYASLNPGIVNEATHKDLARETAEKGAVLLKNDGILPLGAKGEELGRPSFKSIVVLGPDALLPATDVTTKNAASGLGDRGSSSTNPPYAVSILDGLKSRAGSEISVVVGASPADAAKAELAIIPVAMAHEDEGEHFDGGMDRQNMHLRGPHPFHWPASLKPEAFIAQAVLANPNIVVLLLVGSAVLPADEQDRWMTQAKAIVQTFYPGQEGGAAIARLLFGDVNFSGKLPFTVASQDSDYPAFQNATKSSVIEYLHGYRRVEQNGAKPLYWFGYGQSYTTFAYADLKVLCGRGITSTGRLAVEVKVTNTGKMAGDEIVQLYIGYPHTKISQRMPKEPHGPPLKELKAFRRVRLEPGESKVVSLTVSAKDMAYWEGKWAVEKGEHRVLVGPSADPAVLLSVPFSIE